MLNFEILRFFQPRNRFPELYSAEPFEIVGPQCPQLRTLFGLKKKKDLFECHW